LYKVFVEYKVFPENREAYIAFMREIQTRYPQVELLEATDQHQLFVEIWEQSMEEEYYKFKQGRLQLNHEEWSTLHAWIQGGAAKINIWRFQQMK
jgi:hypothetical protein